MAGWKFLILENLMFIKRTFGLEQGRIFIELDKGQCVFRKMHRGNNIDKFRFLKFYLFSLFDFMPDFDLSNFIWVDSGKIVLFYEL